MRIDGVEVLPLTPERWSDFETVLGKGGISGCWCMYWICASSKSWSEGARGGSRATNRAAFRRIVRHTQPGLLAYQRDEPVAWCRVMPLEHLPGLRTSRYFKTDLDIETVWSLSCFVVRSAFRGQGYTTLLTKAAIRFARWRGGRVLEVYPTGDNIGDNRDFFRLRPSPVDCPNSLKTWRRDWDSNPGDALTSNGFQDRRLRPLGHPSGTSSILPSPTRRASCPTAPAAFTSSG